MRTQGSKIASRRVALPILAVSMIISAALLLWWGRDQSMIGDDLFYAVRLSKHSLGHAILYSNVYLIAAPLLVYKAMFEIFGIGDYLPYRIVEIALVLACAGLFYALARRLIGDLLALPPTILLLLFGSGWEVLITGTRIPALIAVASGLGAMLTLERDDRRRNAAAAALLCISVTSHPTGVAFLAAGAAMIALRPGLRRWATSWIVLVPAFIFGAWILFFRTSPYGPSPTISDVITFLANSWIVLTAAVSGLSGVLKDPVYEQTTAKIAGAILLVALLLVAARHLRALRAPFWASLAGLVVLLGAPRLSPEGWLRTPDEPRYLYPEAVFFLLAIIGLCGALRGAGRTRSARALASVATLLVGLGVWSNVAKLNQASEIVRTNSAAAVGQFSLYEIQRSRIDRSFAPNVFFPNAGNYLDASAAYGSIGKPPGELAKAPLAVRNAADATALGALGVRMQRGPAVGPSAGEPQLQRLIDGAADRRAGCVLLRPRAASRSGSATAAVPAQLGVLRLPPGGAQILADDPSQTALYLGRFGIPQNLLEIPPGARTTVLRIPGDGVAAPWKLLSVSSGRITVCGPPG